MFGSIETGAIVALSLCAALTLVNCLSIAIAAWRIGRNRGTPSFPSAAPISLVRPVCGLEAFSEETLLASFRLDYPAYELIFCVADAGDPILPMLERRPSLANVGQNAVGAWIGALTAWYLLRRLHPRPASA